MKHIKSLDYKTIFSALPARYLLLTPELIMVAATNDYFAITHTRPEQILNRYVFDVFPENADTEYAQGSKSLSASLSSVLRTKKPHTMPVLRYDIRLPDEEGGQFVARWWRITNTPIVNTDGNVDFIVNAVDDISHMIDILESAEDTVKASKNQNET